MSDPIQLGRYSLFAKLASGGMATVYLGRLNGEVGFGRTVAIKRLHPHLASEPEFVSMFVDEARLAARVQHPNVVPTVDVVTTEHELFLVMEYIRGESLGGLLRAAFSADLTVPIPVVASCAVGFLSGLHAAHEAKDEQGRPLSIVHRDVSPQNVFVGVDGVTRVLDFGVAKAAMRLQTTKEGQLKGKLAYMPPEQIRGTVTRRSDIYAAGVVIWEALAGRRLYVADSQIELVHKLMEAIVEPPSAYNPEVTPELDQIVLKALARDPADRYATAEEMAEAIDTAIRPASALKVADWVRAVAGEKLAARAELVAQIESNSSPGDGPGVARLLGSLPSIESSPSVVTVGATPDARLTAAEPAPASTTSALPVEASSHAASAGSGRSRALPAIAALSAIGIAALVWHAQQAPVREAASQRPSVPSVLVTSVFSLPSATDDDASATPAPSAAREAPVTRGVPVKASPHTRRSPAPASPSSAPTSLQPPDINALIDSR
jgi:serine/threonine protein kinase